MKKKIITPVARCAGIALFLLLYILIICLLIRWSESRHSKYDAEEQRQKNEIEQYHLSQGRHIQFVEETIPNCNIK